jgi:3-hydroxyacyl-CoA dehydrogenase
MMDTVVKDGIAVLFLDNPPVNALSAALRKVLYEEVTALCARDDVAAMVLAGRGRCFCGGADIHEFDKPDRHREPAVPALIEAIEVAGKPIVAAIHGVALGGGCELALGCHYRIASPDARLGLPETKLGLMPGAGGTQRLPRLVGLGPALEMILSGVAVTAARALEIGLLDRVTKDDLVEASVAFAKECASRAEPPERTSARAVPEAAGADADAVLAAAGEKYLRRARGLIAPGHCIESVGNALRMSFDDAVARERELFLECRESEQSKAQRHVFFAEREAAKVAGFSREGPVEEIQRAAIVGCGTMGAGIAVCFANAGIPTVIQDASGEALAKGFERIRGVYDAAAGKGRISNDEAARRLARIQPVEAIDAVADADIVIEAVVEDMAVKQVVFQELDAVCKPAAILATNTSSLDVNAIAAVTSRPDKVVGTHFFSPANVMKLMENVRADKTSDATAAAVMKLSRTLGKVGVLVGVCDGFVGNRMYHNYTRQASFLLEEGALPGQVDKCIYDYGFPMGPFAVGDLAGLDISWRIRQRRAATRPANERYCPIADRLCERGRFGQKSGAGWYAYGADGRVPRADAQVETLIRERSLEMGIERREIDAQEIIERCVYLLVNEGARILEEGIARRPGDIDVIWIYGYGFPVHRGGPMFFADRVGLGNIRDALLRHYERHGDEALKPAPMIEDLAAANAGFYSRYAG